jgi:hypothetical protein
MTTTQSSLPPPPPPSTPEVRGFDLGRSFTFVFQDPRWLEKVVVGGLFYIASIFIIGWFFLLGYMARIVRHVVEGRDQELPEWNDLGSMFVDGLKLFLVGFLWYVPLILLIIPVIVAAIVLEQAGGGEVGGLVSGCMMMLIVPLALIITFVLPAALLRTAVYGTVEAGLKVGSVFGFVKANFVNFLLAFVVYLAASFIGQFGVIIFCFGVFFTAFWGMAVAAHAYGQVWAYGEKD